MELVMSFTAAAEFASQPERWRAANLKIGCGRADAAEYNYI
jgi:hypothetical protein